MDQIELEATNREILGKKVSVLRRQGITPIHLYGHGIESLALQSETVRLQRVLAQAGKTRLISLKFDKGKRPRSVMVREVQTEPITGGLLHVDLYQVKMTEQVKVEIPVVLVGEAPALKSKENTLLHELATLSIECLPANIPNSIEVDVSSLTESEQALRVKDIKLDEEINVLNDPEVLLVRISSRPVEKIGEPGVAEEKGVAEAPEEGSLSEKEAKE